MRRRNLTKPGTEGAQEQETPPTRVPGRATMDVRVSGDPDEVKNKLNLRNKDDDRLNAKPDKKNEELFVEALNNPKYRFSVKRVKPTEWQGRDAKIVVLEDQCPLQYADIVEEVTEKAGGRKYRITVFDPNNSDQIAFKFLDISADPKLPPPKENQESFEDLMSEEVEETDMEQLDKTMNEQISMANKRLRFEQAREMLDSMKAKKDTGGKVDDGRMARLERMLEEEKREREKDRIQAQHDREMSEMKARLAAVEGKKPENTEMSQVLNRLIDMQSASDKRLEAFMKSQQESKVDLILKELSSKKDSVGGLGNLTEQIRAMKMIRDVFDGKEVDDEGEVGEPKEWWEKLIDHIPGIMDKLSDMSKSGKKVSKDDFLKEVGPHIDEAIKEERARAEAEAMAANRGLPAPKPEAPAAPTAPAASVGRPVSQPPAETVVTELPPAAPGAITTLPAAKPAAAPAPAAPTTNAGTTNVAAVATVAAQPGVPTVEQEILMWVSGVIVLLEREISLRKKTYEWNYEGMWNNFPEALLEKVCVAADVNAMLDALRVPNLPPEVGTKLDGLKATVAESQRAAAWLTRGLNELKDWWKNALEDPDFDPFDDEDGDETPEQA